ncbi:MAG TPA: nucleoside triphosphate pyrophosphohydrolase [Desulfotomaculum sp.]|nr:nucleoside triphosphate pyrophosphohydrolase [Desulfotomaculum sp.]
MSSASCQRENQTPHKQKARITVVGLGPGSPGQIPLMVWEALKQGERLLLRTGEHPVVPWLKKQGIVFTTFDSLYEAGTNFQDVYKQIASSVLEQAGRGPVIYAVPGNPFVAEETVELIIKEAASLNLDVDVLPAMSFLDAIIAALGIDPSKGLLILDGSSFKGKLPQPNIGNIILQVYNRLIASDIKLLLMESYPPDYKVVIVRAAGVPDLQRIEEHPLYRIDRLDWIDHLTSIYLPPGSETAKASCPMDQLVEIMEILRSENGCPWDREQTHMTLRKYVLEESYEVVDAIEQEDVYKICEELGDLLLQIVFHSQLAREKGAFDLNDVIAGIIKKMIERHPHVFGNVIVAESAEVESNWEMIKNKEKKISPQDSILDDVPKYLPAILRAGGVQAEASKVGFDWTDYRGAMKKVKEELEELTLAIAENAPEEVEAEVGDLFFALTNLSRLLGVDAEVALSGTVNRFIKRFHYIEEKAWINNKEITEFSLDQLDVWWEEAKIVEKNKKSRNYFLGGRNL